MANVLPTQARKAVLRRLNARFIAVGSLALSLAAMIAILALSPSLVSVYAARGALISPPSTDTSTLREDQLASTRTRLMVQLLSPVAASTSSPSGAIAEVIAVQPESISISQMQYSRGSPAKLTLSGVSSRREAVNNYRNALSEIGMFSDISVPVAALVGTQEGRFTMTLTGDF